jgi:hypothetical protein
MFISSTDESSQPFEDFAFDGVLGLAQESMAQSTAFSIMTMMQEKSVLRDPLFSVFLSDSDEETSEITFGTVRQEHMAGDLFWVDVVADSGYWEVRIDDITFDNKRQSLCEDCKVAVDTGTSQLAGPSSLIEQLRKELRVKADCSNMESLPKLGFIIGGRVLNMMPSDYVDTWKGDCDLALMTLDIPPPSGPLFIFGIPFLQRFFTVYDTANKRVGFATAKHKVDRPDVQLLEAAPEPSIRASPTSLLSRSRGMRAGTSSRGGRLEQAQPL